MLRFSDIGVFAARYKITTAKMFAKCADFHAELIHAFTLILRMCAAKYADFHVLASLRPYADTPFLDEKLTPRGNISLEVMRSTSE